MIDVVVVSSIQNKNIYYLSPNSLELRKNDLVVFEAENGMLIGIVCKEIYKEKQDNLVLPLNKVIRIATDKDIKKDKKSQEDAKKALSEAKKISKKMNLDMNFVDAYYNFDNSQLVFLFLSDNRVDFRELAKKLASKYKTRIELRQVGVRDKAKKIGGLGPCGLFLCCNSFLTDFNSVSINMAKNQMLALNPSKINGILILRLDAPTSLIISISLLREKIVILIVFDIKKAVTSIKAATIAILIFFTTSNTVISCSTIPSPYLTVSTFSIFSIFLAISPIVSSSFTLTRNVS